MSAYGYGPPPPPPSAMAQPPPPSSSGGYSHSSASFPHRGQRRGGGGSQSSRGRGGQYPHARDYHGPAQPHYDYAGQPYANHLGYGPTHAASTSGYLPPPLHWSSEHGHTQHGTHPHAPAPLSSANYHPNYTPPYPQTAHHPQTQSYSPAQPYVQAYQGHPAPQIPHWPPPVSQPPSQYSPGRSREGYGDRGGGKFKHAGNPGRRGYEYESSPAVAPPFPPPVAHDSRVAQYHTPSFPYSGASLPPPPPSAVRRDGQNGHNWKRGRGGGHRDGSRGRGGHQNNSQPSHHGKNRHGNKSHQAENKQPKPKQEPPTVGKKKKRKVNTLGLTPGVESESEDDEGEEEVLTDLIGANTLHVSDVATFLAERRKNYPTKARVEAKKAAQVAQKSHDKTAELEKQAERLRKQLARVESSIKRKREQGDEGDEMRGLPAESSGDEGPEVVSSRAEATPSQPSSSKKADVSRHCKYYATGGVCGKKGKCRFVHDREVREAAIKEREANNGRLTLQQRLLLNDKEQEDLAVIRSIQYLRQKGLMGSAADDAESQNVEKTDVGKEDNEEDSLQVNAVPAPAISVPSSEPTAAMSPPTLPVNEEQNNPGSENAPRSSQTPAAESVGDEEVKTHDGWLLQPYGSSDGNEPKSDDLP